MSWIQTRRGRAVDLDSPRPEDIDGHELAVLLSRLGRWGNHTLTPYSVAEHSVRVSLLVEQMILPRAVYGRSLTTAELCLAALLHDAHEGYLGLDATRPLKTLIGAALAPLEAAWDQAIAAHFRIDLNLLEHPLVKLADAVLLSTERRDLMAPCQRSWEWMPPPPLAEVIVPCPTSSEAYAWFHSRLESLLKTRDALGDMEPHRAGTDAP